MKLSAPISILAMDFSGRPFPLESKSGYLLICSSSNVNTVDTYMVLICTACYFPKAIIF
ncbi:hypothetical protein Syun_031347 [Stephania yunnanensis]|uniref:Uncharacterized protein n=1 Tax=Stephania yunnanensis TaxID=152371 RepID=A0AAP0DTN7_9MAGN